jgi:hypothetical protein
VLEPVEHLFQRELYSRQNSAMAARHAVSARGPSRKREHGGASGDENRQVGDDESQAKETSSYSANAHEQPANADSSRATLVDVRVEPNDHACGINGKNRCRHLCCID